MTFRQMADIANKKGYGLSKEKCQYSNKTMFTIYLGNFKTGIFTIMKSSNKKNIIDKLNNMKKARHENN